MHACLLHSAFGLAGGGGDAVMGRCDSGGFPVQIASSGGMFLGPGRCSDLAPRASSGLAIAAPGLIMLIMGFVNPAENRG